MKTKKKVAAKPVKKVAKPVQKTKPVLKSVAKKIVSAIVKKRGAAKRLELTVVDARPNCPPCPETPANEVMTPTEMVDTLVSVLNAPAEAAVPPEEQEAADIINQEDGPSHWLNTPLADIPEVFDTVRRFAFVRDVISRLEDIKDRLSGDMKTWMELAGLEGVVAGGMSIKRVATERKSFDRTLAVEKAHLTEGQIEACVKKSMVVQLRIAAVKAVTEEAGPVSEQ